MFRTLPFFPKRTNILINFRIDVLISGGMRQDPLVSCYCSLGCARMPFADDEPPGKALCCLNLSAYANGDKDAFRFFTA